MVMTSPAETFSLDSASIILAPRSYTVSISVVFRVSMPVFSPDSPASLISISTTSPSMSSVSSMMRTPMERRNACVNASVLLISSEKISLAANMVNGVSSPSACAMPIAMAVLPVPGCPARSTARPAILPSWIMRSTMPAALRASNWPTMPCDVLRGSSESSRPKPRMWECAPMRSIRVTSFTSCVFTSAMAVERGETAQRR
mmetsp:Transcript_42700/g.87185  ORF Transcript_42700/g.87185 Transcript_42700/m.87185 type:complete len:202 (-) Transcript_42700:81-686(-)